MSIPVSKFLVILGVLLTSICQAQDMSEQEFVDELRRSHIEAHLPPKDKFLGLLERDLNSYFENQVGRKVKIDYQFFRKAPTQSGLSFPVIICGFR